MITITNILDCEQYLGNVQGVIFDLDDTLYAEKDYIRSGYRAVATGFPQVVNMAQKLWDAFEKNQLAIDAVLEAEGLATIENKAKALQLYRYHIPDISLYSGVLDLLQRLAGCKKLGMITDGRPEGQWAKIEALRITPYFEKIIVTDELGGPEFRKPNEIAFRLMQQALDIPFPKMVYIGDNTKKDFIAPLALGMKAIYYKNTNGMYVV